MINEKNINEMEIDLIALMRALLKRAWVIILAVVVCGAGMAAYSAMTYTPLYKASTLIDISVEPLEENETASSYVNTFVTIINSRTILEAAIDEANLDYSYEDLQSMVVVNVVDGVQLYSIEVTGKEAKDVAEIANAIVKVLPEQTAAVVDRSSVKVVDKAVEPSNAFTQSNMKKNLVLGMMIGFVLSCGALVLIELFADRVYGKEMLLRLFNLPILAVIPKSRKKDEAVICDKSKEYYKVLRTNIAHSLSDVEGCKVIGVTSTIEGEGKTTTAINLANEMANAGKKVLLIDANMRYGKIADVLGLEASNGLSNFVTERCDIKDIICNSNINENMFIIATGNKPSNPAELLSSEKMKDALAALKGMFDIVVLDLPQVSGISDASIASAYADGIAVVVQQDRCHRKGLIDAIRQFEFLNTNVLGFVMIKSTTQYKFCNLFRK